MDNLLTVAFEAHHDERNVHRWYQVVIGRDLLNDWTVNISYGRAGLAGQQMAFGGPQEIEMRVVVRDRLRRRLSATRRIGCPYRLTRLDSALGFDASHWLPGDIMAEFFAK